MSFYDERILPHLLNRLCSMGPVWEVRERVVPLAWGRVLDVGCGTGLNLSLYDANRVEWVWGLEPSPGMRRKARRQLRRAPVELKWLDLPGEEIPLEDECVDCITLTFTLCSITDWRRALEQMHRVLKPGGLLLFAEHGRAPRPKERHAQDRVTPYWKKLAGGCHLNRPVSDCFRETGFHLESCENFYLPKAPRFMGYMYVGRACRQGESPAFRPEASAHDGAFP